MKPLHKEAPQTFSFAKKMLALLAFVAIVAVLYTLVGRYLKLDYLAEREAQLKAFQADWPWLVVGASVNVAHHPENPEPELYNSIHASGEADQCPGGGGARGEDRQDENPPE